MRTDAERRCARVFVLAQVFGAILADDVRAARTPRGHQEERPTPWIITDDRWSRDLQKSHFHNVLKASTLPAAARPPPHTRRHTHATTPPTALGRPSLRSGDSRLRGLSWLAQA